MSCGPDAVRDVVKVFLEHFDGEAEIPAQLIKFTLVQREPFDDFLPPGLFSCHD